MPLEPKLNLFRLCSPQEDPLHIRVALTANMLDINWYCHLIVPASNTFETTALLDVVLHLFLHDYSVRQSFVIWRFPHVLTEEYIQFTKSRESYVGERGDQSAESREEIALFSVEIRPAELFNNSLLSRDLSGEELVMAAVDSSCSIRHIRCRMRVDLCIPVGIHAYLVVSTFWCYLDRAFHLHQWRPPWHGGEVDSWNKMRSCILWLPIWEIIVSVVLKIDNLCKMGFYLREIFNPHLTDWVKVDPNLQIDAGLVLVRWRSVIFFISLDCVRSDRYIRTPRLLNQELDRDLDSLPRQVVEDPWELFKNSKIALINVSFLRRISLSEFVKFHLE